MKNEQVFSGKERGHYIVLNTFFFFKYYFFRRKEFYPIWHSQTKDEVADQDSEYPL